MTKEQISESKKVMRVLIQSQALLHAIEDLHDLNTMKGDFKRNTNKYIKFLETKLYTAGMHMSSKERHDYTDVVNEVSSFFDKMEIEYEQTQLNK